MRKYLLILISSLFLVSCALHAPEIRGGEKFNLDKVDGQTIKFTAGANVYNGNWFGIKIKPSKLDLYVEGDYVGKVSLDKKVKLKRKRETAVEAPLTAFLEKGTLMKVMRYAGKDQVTVRLKGKAKGGVFIFSKKVEIDETRTISGKNLRMGG